jgi:DNA-binding XRE family transcriptional regulator
MEKNGHLKKSKVIIEEEIKCPLCGEVVRRRVERESVSLPVERYNSEVATLESQFHHVGFNSLARLFFQRRIGQGLTLKELSNRIGFSEKHIESVERGERVPSLKYSLSCAEVFGINVSWVKGRLLKEMVSSFEQKLVTRLNFEEEV